jgi:transcriptional regulator with XRE-family HTH domain
MPLSNALLRQERSNLSRQVRLAIPIAERRISAGVSVHDLAERVGTPEERIEAIERGEDITVAEAIRIAHVLDMAVAIEPDSGTPSGPRRTLRAELLLEAPTADLGEHMIKPELDEILRLPLDPEERFLMDPDTWDWESTEEGGPGSDPGAFLAVEHSDAELEQLAQAAAAAGMTINAYSKLAVIKWASNDGS